MSTTEAADLWQFIVMKLHGAQLFVFGREHIRTEPARKRVDRSVAFCHKDMYQENYFSYWFIYKDMPTLT